MVDGPRPSGSPSPVPKLSGSSPGFLQSMQRHAHPAGMKRDPYFAAQGGSGSADAATTRCRGVRKQHQIPGGGSCPTISITTSSLLAPAQAEAHSPIDSRRPGSASCSSSAVTISPASGPIWDSTEVFVNGKYRAPEFWLDNHGEEFPPEVNYYVGGNTKFYGAALFRLRPQDFGEIQHFGGKSPAWPIHYQDLKPYYTQAEHLYLVCR